MTIEKIVQRRLTDGFNTTLPRFDVLAALERRPQGMTMGELSRALLVSNGNVTAIVQKLVKDGAVTSTPLASDRRSSLIQLTPAGAKSFKGLARAHHDWIDTLFADLQPAERDAMFSALGHLKQSLGNAAHKDRS
ncbi:MAG: MarR family transcriptional regulator [Sphingomonadaceae bacterium]|nr:MarR family transcriptional regulator [Sphingomonadaceae bacterium]